MPTDILFTNTYHSSNDHRQQATMLPCPALGPLDVAAYPREHSYTVDFFDFVFQTNEDALLTNVRLLQPRFVGAGALVIVKAARPRRDRRPRTIPWAGPGFSHYD